MSKASKGQVALLGAWLVWLVYPHVAQYNQEAVESCMANLRSPASVSQDWAAACRAVALPLHSFVGVVLLVVSITHLLYTL